MTYRILSAAVLTAAIALAAWYADRHRAARYHRHRWEHERCHAAPTRLHRARLALQRLGSLRIRITTSSKTRTA